MIHLYHDIYHANPENIKNIKNIMIFADPAINAGWMEAKRLGAVLSSPGNIHMYLVLENESDKINIV